MFVQEPSTRLLVCCIAVRLFICPWIPNDMIFHHSPLTDFQISLIWRKKKIKIQEQSAWRRGDEQKLVAVICRGIPKRVEQSEERNVAYSQADNVWNGEERNGNYPIRSVLFSKNFNTSPLKTLRGPLVYQLLKLSPSLVYFVVFFFFFSFTWALLANLNHRTKITIIE